MKIFLFLLCLPAPVANEFLRQFPFGPIGPDAHQDEDAQGTHQNQDHKASKEAGPDGDGFAPGKQGLFY